MTCNNDLSYEFGPYQLDPSKRILTRDGETIALTPKATDILLLLVRHAGHLVEKDELLKEVWPDTFVEEANLSQNIFTLRRALGDDRTGPKYIETVARRGYRFLANVRAVPQSGAPASPPTGTAQSPVVAVLPFLNNTGDPELDVLADSLTANIINHLSRLPHLRVMSRTAVHRYKMKNVEPQRAGKDLGVDAMLIGKIDGWSSGLSLDVELVEVGTGWQLWGNTLNCDREETLEIQESIVNQTWSTLKLKLSSEKDQEIAARYTESAGAYKSYIEGRQQWSKYTKQGIERAIKHFKRAIELDPNYALAYSAVVDCYLRLATNYLPPPPNFIPSQSGTTEDPEPPLISVADSHVKLRFEWDWKAAERELRRANDLKMNYPAPYQWYAAYRLATEVLVSSSSAGPFSEELLNDISAPQLYSGTLSPNEECQILCAVAREQMEIGNYDAGCLILKKYWTPGEWPRLGLLTSQSSADLLFTTGSLAGCFSSTGRIHKGQKHAEALLGGAIGIFENLGAKRGVAEAKIELALSYYRQGMFDLASTLLQKLMGELQTEDNDLKSLALVRLAVVERHAGRVDDSFSRLSAASTIVDQGDPLISGRYHQELAAVLKDSAVGNDRLEASEIIQTHFARARYEFEAIGHLRYTAVVENNHGYFLFDLGEYEGAEFHLLRAHERFESLDDRIRRAQVDDCLSKLYMATGRPKLAESAINRAITSLEIDDEEALLAETLTTKGLLFCRLNRHREGRQILEGAWRIAERCGDYEGAGRALLTLIEETHSEMDEPERTRMGLQIRELLENTQQASTRVRLAQCLNTLLTTDSQNPKKQRPE